MSLKLQIQQNEEKLGLYRRYIDKMALLSSALDHKALAIAIAEMEIIEFEGRVEWLEKKLEKDRKDYMVLFEQQSAEANLRIDRMAVELSKWIGKDPLGVTCKIEPLVKAYEAERDGISQERRNELYLEMRGHWEFLTKTYKNK